MALYVGPPLLAGPVSLVRPDVAALTGLLAEADLTEHQKGWYERAAVDTSVLYFCIEHAGHLVGQIMLHDIDGEANEAMVGYHLFRPDDRGKGFGTAALGALCDYAFAELGLGRLVMITSLDNAPSRRIAERCGFRSIGPAREGPDLVGYERLAG